MKVGDIKITNKQIISYSKQENGFQQRVYKRKIQEKKMSAEKARLNYAIIFKLGQIGGLLEEKGMTIDELIEPKGCVKECSEYPNCFCGNEHIKESLEEDFKHLREDLKCGCPPCASECTCKAKVSPNLSFGIDYGRDGDLIGISIKNPSHRDTKPNDSFGSSELNTLPCLCAGGTFLACSEYPNCNCYMKNRKKSGGIKRAVYWKGDGFPTNEDLLRLDFDNLNENWAELNLATCEHCGKMECKCVEVSDLSDKEMKDLDSLIEPKGCVKECSEYPYCECAVYYNDYSCLPKQKPLNMIVTGKQE